MIERIWKVPKLVFLSGLVLGFVLILAVPRFINDGSILAASRPMVKIGAVKKQFGTDALCVLVYNHQVIWVNAYGQDEIWMNLDGKDTRLLEQPSRNSKISLFKADESLIEVVWGVSQPVPLSDQVGMDGAVYKNAKLTLTKGRQSLSLPVFGGCDGGATLESD